MFILIALGVLLCYYVYTFYASRSRLPAGPTPLPFIGNIHQLKSDAPDVTLTEWGKKYGGIYTAEIGSTMVFITDEQLIKEALVKNADALSGRPRNFFMGFFSKGYNGIIASDGHLGQSNRRFALHTLKDMGVGSDLMEAKIMHQVRTLVAAMGKVGDSEYSIDDDLQLAVGNIICDVLWGKSYTRDSADFFEVVRHVEQNFHLVRQPQFFMLDSMPWLRHLPILDHFNTTTIGANLDCTYKYLRERMAERRVTVDLESEEAATDFIDAFYRARHRHFKTNPGAEQEATENTSDPWSMVQLEIMLGDLFVAGMETSVTTIKWAVLYMIHNPEAQSKARKEIHALLGTEREAGLGDKAKLPYVQAYVTEIQRVANIVGFNISHRCTRDVTIGGHLLPKDTTVVPHIAAVLCYERIFENPAEFRPERFIVEVDGRPTFDKEHADRMIPFALGKRQCLGITLAKAELFLIITALLQNFVITQIVGEPLPSLKPIFGATNSPEKFKFMLKRCTD